MSDNQLKSLILAISDCKDPLLDIFDAVIAVHKWQMKKQGRSLGYSTKEPCNSIWCNCSESPCGGFY